MRGHRVAVGVFQKVGDVHSTEKLHHVLPSERRRAKQKIERLSIRILTNSVTAIITVIGASADHKTVFAPDLWGLPLPQGELRREHLAGIERQKEVVAASLGGRGPVVDKLVGAGVIAEA